MSYLSAEAQHFDARYKELVASKAYAEFAMQAWRGKRSETDRVANKMASFGRDGQPVVMGLGNAGFAPSSASCSPCLLACTGPVAAPVPIASIPPSALTTRAAQNNMAHTRPAPREKSRTLHSKLPVSHIVTDCAACANSTAFGLIHTSAPIRSNPTHPPQTRGAVCSRCPPRH